jgi:hypothetical protein
LTDADAFVVNDNRKPELLSLYRKCRMEFMADPTVGE